MKLEGHKLFNSYADFKKFIRWEAFVQAPSVEEGYEYYYKALDDFDYYESKKYGKLAGSGEHKTFVPFHGHTLSWASGKFIVNYRGGEIESIVLSPKALCKWYESPWCF